MKETGRRRGIEQIFQKPESILFQSKIYGLDVGIGVAPRNINGQIKESLVVIPQGSIIGVMRLQLEGKYFENLLSLIRGMKSFVSFLDTKRENSQKYPFPDFLLGQAPKGVAMLAERVGFSVASAPGKDGLVNIIGETREVKDEFKTFLHYYGSMEEELLKRAAETDPKFWKSAPEQEGAIWIPDESPQYTKDPKSDIAIQLIFAGMEAAFASLAIENHDFAFGGVCGLATGFFIYNAAKKYKLIKEDSKRSLQKRLDWQLNPPSEQTKKS